MTFEDYRGHDRTVGSLRRLVAQDRLPSSLLFEGPKGVGKFTLARLLAMAVHCEGPPETAPCASCDPCRSIASLEDLGELRRQALKERGSTPPDQAPLILRPHPHVTVLVPDGAFIRVSQMRYVIRNAYSIPSGERSRLFFLIDEAEKLRADLADVLLKVLEEPPPRTTLILVTHEPYKLRQTVRSRCLPFSFSPLAAEEITAELDRRKAHGSAADRSLAAAVADGSLGRALTLDLGHYREVRSRALRILQAAASQPVSPDQLFSATSELAGRGKLAVAGAEEEAESRKDSIDFALEVIYSLVNDVLYFKVRGPKGRLRNPDVTGDLEHLASHVGYSWLEHTTGSLDDLVALRRRNVNRQLSLDAIALRAPARRTDVGI